MVAPLVLEAEGDGPIGVRVTCPSCGESGVVPIELASRLTMVTGEQAKLGVRVKSPTLPHLCGQLTIDEALRALEAEDD